ncbi:PUA domain-containing protein, partial [Photobacterium sanctipauli]
RAGIEVIIAAGSRTDVIADLVKGESVGTRFLPLESPLESRKRWILAGPPPAGDIVIDDGAVAAVQQRGSSLLSKGITRVSGEFERGEVARIFSSKGELLARGISRYSSADLAKIAGKHSQDIHKVLGYEYGPVAVHRDDLVVI